MPLSRLIGVKIHCPRLQIKRPTYNNTGKGRLFYHHSNLRCLFFSYLKYKNKLIIDIFVTGILSGLVSITGDSKMFMIFYLLIFYERIGLFQNQAMTLFVVPPKFCISIVFQLQLGLRLCVNGHNIVDQQLPTLLDVTCCVRLHTLLHVGGRCCLLLRQV